MQKDNGVFFPHVQQVIIPDSGCENCTMNSSKAGPDENTPTSMDLDGINRI